jgi:GxxExxY protein
MPIEVHAELRRPTPEEFTSLAFDVMACVFEVHNEMGRFFDERVYKQLLAARMGGVQLEVPIIVRLDDFEQRYWLDMLVRGAAVFEWKAVAGLAPRHRAQLLNYLLLCDLPRGKLVNVRPALVEHEFVNTTQRPNDRREFQLEDAGFSPLDAADRAWKDFLIAGLGEWETGLDLHLYEAAISHALGGEDQVIRDIEVVANGRPIGRQRARVTAAGAAIKVTALADELDAFESHARRFLWHTRLTAVHWVNITRHCVSLKTLTRDNAQGQSAGAANVSSLPASSCH